MARNHKLACDFEEAWLKAFDLESMYTSREQFGSIVTVRLPISNVSTLEEADAFRDMLYLEHNVEIPIFIFENELYTRFSGQDYVKNEWISELISIIKSSKSHQN